MPSATLSTDRSKIDHAVENLCMRIEDNPQTGVVGVESTLNSGDFNICAWWYGI